MEIIDNLEVGKRWNNYRLANTRFPKVRKKELLTQLKLTSPKKGETIAEVGTGNGYLTFVLANKVGNKGRIITYDYQKSNLNFVNNHNKKGLPITTIHQNLNYDFEISSETVDKRSSIATLHHYDDRSKGTGTKGRERAIKEFYRILKKGGKLVIGDVAHETPTQKYFDSIDNPIDCSPNGHPHDFLYKGLAIKLCKKAGFKKIKFKIEKVPWEFESEKQAGEFLHTIHNSKCSPKKSLDNAKRTLKFWKENNKFYLEWELFYLTAEK